MIQKESFIEALAEYLTANQAYQSIRLETGNPDAEAWAKIRSATCGVRGWVTKQDAIADLNRWFATWSL